MSWKLKREAGEFCFINRMIDTQTFVQALEQEKSFEWKKQQTGLQKSETKRIPQI
jgi:hypothetical protein